MKDLIKMMQKAVNVHKFIIVFFIFITSCSINKETISKTSKEYEVLNHILKNSNGNIYYKTIIKEAGLPIDSYVKDKYLEFYLCVSKIDSPIKINKKDLSFLKNEFKNISILRLDKLFPKLSKQTIKKKVRLTTSFITTPILFNNNTMAIYYSVQTYGGEFKLLQKDNSKWVTICSNSVWVE